jgi:hypothetical protein
VEDQPHAAVHEMALLLNCLGLFEIRELSLITAIFNLVICEIHDRMRALQVSADLVSSKRSCDPQSFASASWTRGQQLVSDSGNVARGHYFGTWADLLMLRSATS